MKILIADDEKDLCRALQTILLHAQFQAEYVTDGEDALYYATHGDYDLLILDIMMPKLNGLDVLREIRKVGLSMPILMLTAKSENADIVQGLRAGADDYLAKPFSMEVLLARVEALLRRPAVSNDKFLSTSVIQIDRNTLTIRSEDRVAELTGKEFQLLELLLTYKGQTFSVDQIMDKVWGVDSDSDRAVVWTNVSSLRKKLSEIHAGVEIRNLRNLGYYLEGIDV